MRVPKHLVNVVEGACGINHVALEFVTAEGADLVTREVEHGVEAEIVLDGDVIGKGEDVTWAPALMEACLDAGVFEGGLARELSDLLTPRRDMKRLGGIYGFGRIVTVGRVACSVALASGGEVVVRRDGVGVRVTVRFDGETSSYTSYCPACALALAAATHPTLAEALEERLADAPNTGREKAEDGVVTAFRVSRGITFCELRTPEGRVVNRGCCIAYAAVRAELKAGYGSEETRRLMKAYCDSCPLKHCWVGRPISAIGGAVLQRLTELEGDVPMRVGDYPEVLTPAGVGRGTLCALSACANALLRLDARELLRPDPSRPEAWGDGVDPRDRDSRHDVRQG